jgi:hypothetical protein
MKDLTQFEPKYRTLVGYLTGDEDNTLRNILSEVSRKSHIPEELIKADTRKIESFKGKYFYYRRVFETQHAYTFAQIGAVVSRDHSSVTTGLKTGNIRYKAEYDKLFYPSQSKPVERLKNGKVIKRYESIKSASILTGFIIGNINRSIQKGWKVKGFTFRYAE